MEGSEQNSGVPERTKNPLADAEGKSVPEKQKAKRGAEKPGAKRVSKEPANSGGSQGSGSSQGSSSSQAATGGQAAGGNQAAGSGQAVGASQVPGAPEAKSVPAPTETKGGSAKPGDEQTENPLPGEPQQPPEKREAQLERDLPKNLLKDQIAIWTSPAYVRTKDALWLVPFFGVTAGFIATDRAAVSDLPGTPNTVKRFKDVSNYGLYGTAALSGAMYLSGVAFKNPHQRETGWLVGEAMLDGLAVNTVIQQITRREQPFASSHPGQWFQSGDAFPSNHAMATFAAAAVFTREYPGLLTDVLAYGTAGTVASLRVLGEQHSPSDVVVGSMIGYLIGRQVYKAHHNPELPGESIGTVVKTKETESGGSGFVASAYVPMDSYVYPLLDRLMATGAVDSGILGQRPWTRSEIARLVEEGSERVRAGSEEARIVDVLQREFADNLEGSSTRSAKSIAIEELYTRSQVISGTPVNDSFHFGQTLYDDYGRPYWKGYNNISGVSGTAVTGRFVMYGRGEYRARSGDPRVLAKRAAV